MNRLLAVAAFLLALSACSLSNVQQSPMSFVVVQSSVPVGYGAATRGGSGGVVIPLATSADAPLRAALARNEPRIILLTGSGILDLTSDITLIAPFLTLDGSGAPDLQIRGAMFIVRTHDVIFRNLRIRPGDAGAASSLPNDRDAISLNGAQNEVYNILIDRCSLMWAPDMGALSILDSVHHVTVQNSILGPGLYLSRHKEGTTAEGGHSMSTSAFQLNANRSAPHSISFVHNLFTSADRRMPVVYGDNIEIINNVVYNWKRRPMGGNPRSANVLNNYVKRGPMTERLVAWSPQPHSSFPTLIGLSVFEAGTKVDGAGMVVRESPAAVYRSTPWPMALTTTQSADEAYIEVLAQAGAFPRDSSDARVIADVRAGTGSYPNGSTLNWSTTPQETPVPTSEPTATTAQGWTILTCSAGQIEIEKVDAVTGRWRCVP